MSFVKLANYKAFNYSLRFVQIYSTVRPTLVFNKPNQNTKPFNSLASLPFSRKYQSFQFLKMSSHSSKSNYHTRTPLFLPPVDRTMKTLDKSFFHKKIPLVAVYLSEPSYISAFSRKQEPYLLKQQGLSHVVFLDSTDPLDKTTKPNSKKGILLSEKYQTPEQAEKELGPIFAKEYPPDKVAISFLPYTLHLDYDFWKTDEILGAIMPEELLDEIPSGFTIVGHVAHLNIRDQYLPYKSIIGQVVFDKNSRIRTVVNKLDAIDTVFRTFEMEVLAGEKDFLVEQSESNCRFRFDFSKVYWNSRLHTEHDRLIKKFKKGEAVCDAFAGVGPFAVPAGKKGVIAFASDLNPESNKYLVENIKLNKVEKFVKPFCEDARTFIKDGVVQLLEFAKETPSIEVPPKGRVSRSKPAAEQPKPEHIPVPLYYSHYVMNLPDTATEFLDSFIGLYHDPALRSQIFGSEEPSAIKLPMVHVHCFHKHDPHVPEPSEEEIFNDLRVRVSKKLNHEMKQQDLEIHNVRKVAPTKTMFCISFRLPVEVAIAKPVE